MGTANKSGGPTECKRRFCLDSSQNGGLNPSFDFSMENGRLSDADLEYLGNPVYGNGSTTNTKGEPTRDLSPEADNEISQQIAGAINNASQNLPDGDYRGKQKGKVCWDVIVKKDKDGNVTDVEATQDGNFEFDSAPVDNSEGGGGGDSNNNPWTDPPQFV
jgi:hypothetical protein